MELVPWAPHSPSLPQEDASAWILLCGCAAWTALTLPPAAAWGLHRCCLWAPRLVMKLLGLAVRYTCTRNADEDAPRPLHNPDRHPASRSPEPRREQPRPLLTEGTGAPQEQLRGSPYRSPLPPRSSDYLVGDRFENLEHGGRRRRQAPYETPRCMPAPAPSWDAPSRWAFSPTLASVGTQTANEEGPGRTTRGYGPSQQTPLSSLLMGRSRAVVGNELFRTWPHET